MFIVHASSHFYIDDKFWDDLKISENVVVVSLQFFPTFPNTKCSAIHPPRWLQHSTSAAPRWTSPGSTAPPPSCSPRWASRGARGPAAAPGPPGLGGGAAPPPRRHRGPPAPGRASAVDRHGSRKVSTAPWRREGTIFTICGVVAYFWIQVPGEKTRFWDSNCFDFTWAVATGYTLLMLFDACCKYCWILQSTAFTFAALWDFWMQICGDKTIQFLTQQYVFAIMCVSLWRDWGPHRFSAKSALSCSGPNLSAVASARHRSLGPWWCLSHGCAYHKAVRWSTMSPAWKTNQVQENGQRYAKWPRCGTASGFSQKLPGYWAAIHGPCFAGSSTICFYAWGWGGQVFWNWQTFVLNGAGKFKSTHSIVNRHSIDEYSR